MGGAVTDQADLGQDLDVLVEVGAEDKRRRNSRRSLLLLLLLLLLLC